MRDGALSGAANPPDGVSGLDLFASSGVYLLEVTVFRGQGPVAEHDVAPILSVKAGLIRPVTLWPFPVDAIEGCMGTAKAFLSVEMNMGQMVDDVRLAVNGRRPVEFFGRTGGVIPTPVEVLAQIEDLNERMLKGGE